ncbi:hypothetical protein ACFYY8_07550 [Streptosporangium sp. NPDC001559]|uniref:hypothetical protein n=1 Tax=Streptosporangium sp. NPDC001559 TaxID=3366187 RepID=UPI0036E19EF7
MTLPGRPVDWILGGVVLTLVLIFPLGGIGWPLYLFVMPLAMTAATVLAYQEAARARAADLSVRPERSPSHPPRG